MNTADAKSAASATPNDELRVLSPTIRRLQRYAVTPMRDDAHTYVLMY